MITSRDITLTCTTENDFEDFRSLRKSVMREHVERQGLPWIEEQEDRYHRELFDEGGLKAILFQGTRIGFIGIKATSDAVIIGRFCIVKAYQGRGIGSCVMDKLLAKPPCSEKRTTLDALKLNPARRLFEKFGFILTAQDEKLAYYERPPRRLVQDQPLPI